VDSARRRAHQRSLGANRCDVRSPSRGPNAVATASNRSLSRCPTGGIDSSITRTWAGVYLRVPITPARGGDRGKAGDRRRPDYMDLHVLASSAAGRHEHRFERPTRHAGVEMCMRVGMGMAASSRQARPGAAYGLLCRVAAPSGGRGGAMPHSCSVDLAADKVARPTSCSGPPFRACYARSIWRSSRRGRRRGFAPRSGNFSLGKRRHSSV